MKIYSSEGATGNGKINRKKVEVIGEKSGSKMKKENNNFIYKLRIN